MAFATIVKVFKKLLSYQKKKKYCLQLDIALWCKNQIEHFIWDESLLLSNCACSLEYSSWSTLAGLIYHICGKLEVVFKASHLTPQQHCTDKAEKVDTVLSVVSYIYLLFHYDVILPYLVKRTRKYETL